MAVDLVAWWQWMDVVFYTFLSCLCAVDVHLEDLVVAVVVAFLAVDGRSCLVAVDVGSLA